MLKSKKPSTMIFVLTILLNNTAFLCKVQAQLPFVNMQNNMRIDEYSGLPVAIYNVNSPQYSGTPKQIATQYLLDNNALLGLEENLSDLELIEIKDSPAGHHVGFQQMYQDVPVMRSLTVISINNQNSISMVVNGHKPDISVNIIPTIQEDQALQFAKQAIGTENAYDIFPPVTNLMVYEDSTHFFHLIWKSLIFPSEPQGEWLVIIDAHNGEILEKFNTVFNYVQGTGRIFNPDPGTALRDFTLPDSNDEDYPELQPAYDTVTLNDLNDAVGAIYKVRGRYAWSEDIQAPYDDIVFRFDPDDFIFNRSYNGFEEVNIYYFIDKCRRDIGNLGFTPTWDYLDPNGSEAIAFDARGELDGAFYYPENEYMTFGVPSGSQDAGEEINIIIHEYGHALHDALMIGGLDNADPDTEGISEGIGEYLGVDYRRMAQPSDPFRPNYRSNWFKPNEGTSIRTPANAKYPHPPEGHWGPGRYDRMKVWASTLMDMQYNDATIPTNGSLLGRDITTKLMLTSLSYVTSVSTAIDNVFAIFQADREITEYDGAHLEIIASVFDSRGFFFGNEVSGTITQDVTWAGYKLVTDDIIVNEGVTLTIEPGTFIFFRNSTRLTVNGKIKWDIPSVPRESNDVIFTTASSNPSPGDWDGIFLAGQGSSNSNINHFIIKYAKWGLSIDESSPGIDNSKFEYSLYSGIKLYKSESNIENCIIQNNGVGVDIESHFSSSSLEPFIANSVIHNNKTGIQVFNSGGLFNYNTISNNEKGVIIEQAYSYELIENTIESNEYDGVYLIESSDGLLDGNIIQGNGETAYNIGRPAGGIFLHASSPILTNNIIDNNYVNGLVSMNGSRPIMNLNKRALNRISGNVFVSCGHGTGTAESSEILLFDTSIPFLNSGHNDIIDNQGCYLIYTNNVFIQEDIDVTYNYWAEIDPVLLSGRFFPSEIFRYNPFDINPNTEQQTAQGGGGASTQFQLGLTQESTGNWTSATQTYQSLVSSYPDSMESAGALTRLKVCIQKSSQDFQTLQSYYDSINVAGPGTPLAKTASQYSILCDVAMENYPTAISRYEAILINPPTLADSVYAVIDIGQVYLAVDTSSQGGAKLLALGTMPEYRPVSRKDYEKKVVAALSTLFGKFSSEIEPVIPKNYALKQNYPNPFNPVTSIIFDIPELSNVKLTIYDLLGREIVKLLNTRLNGGIHTVMWDGKDNAGNYVSSGMYFYRIDAISKESEKELHETKKMVLMK